jgi:hypothetical protein
VITVAINIVTGEITNDAREVPPNITHVPRRRTPNWLRAIYAVIAGVVAITALSLTLAPSSGGPEKPIPVCELEDGSTQELCVWHGDDENDYVNHEFGKWWEVHPR